MLNGESKRSIGDAYPVPCVVTLARYARLEGEHEVGRRAPPPRTGIVRRYTTLARQSKRAYTRYC